MGVKDTKPEVVRRGLELVLGGHHTRCAFIVDYCASCVLLELSCVAVLKDDV